MKQKVQIQSESYHTIATALEDVREAAYDISETGIDVEMLDAGVTTIAAWLADSTDPMCEGCKRPGSRCECEGSRNPPNQMGG